MFVFDSIDLQESRLKISRKKLLPLAHQFESFQEESHIDKSNDGHFISSSETSTSNMQELLEPGLNLGLK